MDRIKNILFIFCGAIFVFSLLFNIKQCSDDNRKNVNTKVKRETYIDTIPYHLPIPKDSFEIKYITVRLPVPAIDTTGNITPNNIPDSGNITPNNIPDSGNIADKSVPDSVDASIPITQKVFSDDSTYTAYVSGYMQNLDSLFTYSRHDIITTTEYIKSKPKRWGVGVQVGYGVTMQNNPYFAPYIGVGISYNFLTF